MKSASEFISNLDFNSAQLLRSRFLSKNEFLKTVGDEKVYEAVKKSKVGFIKVWKISDNPGIEKNKIYEGVTSAFGENLSVYVSNRDSWFYTSVIQNIDWDNHQFETMNSVYKFEFDEVDIDRILNELNNSDVTVKIVNKSNNELPDYATNYSAGVDLRAELGDQPSRTLNPGERCLILTGLYIALPEGYEAQIRPRSGLALKHGVTVLNTPGTIDADYRGEIGVILINLGSAPYTIMNGDRIAQMVFSKYERAYFKVSDSLDDTKRGDGGFGSTGIK